MRVYRSDVVSLKSAEARPPRSVHRLDEPTGLFLSMVASPQCRFRFARQNDCSAAAACLANFRVRRHSGPEIPGGGSGRELSEGLIHLTVNWPRGRQEITSNGQRGTSPYSDT
jgi:hypothetical protein